MTTTTQDREINMRLLQQRPDLEHLLTKPSSSCTYDGTSSVVVRTGQLGNRYGLCADCRDSQDRTDTAVEIMEDFRTRMREAGQLTERVEDFINKVVLFASVSKDPRAAIDAVFQMLARECGGASRA